jgi:hypothetical protein
MGTTLVLMLKVGDVTETSRTQDVAQVLACAASAGDTLYVSDAYPYDLPFYAQTSTPIVVLENWPMLRQQAGDGWQRELFEGADFDAKAAQALQPTAVLAQVGPTPGQWFATRSGSQMTHGLEGWVLFYKGAGWDLYRSGAGSAQPSTAKSPESAEHKGLPGCKQESHK